MLLYLPWRRGKMVRAISKNLNIVEYISKKISSILCQEVELEEINYLKLKLGIEVFLINVTKGMIVYGVAIVFGLFIPTLLLHSSYFAVRKVSFGLHAKSSFHCTFISLLFFVAIPYLSKDIIFSDIFIKSIFTIYLLCFYLYAPADTENYPILGEGNRRKLRNKSILTCLVLMIIVITSSNSMLKTLITLGVALQIIQILPLTYKILKRGYKNYEKYETKCTKRN